MNDRQHLIEVWLANAEKDDPAIQDRLRQLFARYQNTRNTVVVYRSGHEDPYRCTLDLLAANRLCGRARV